ncbi:hypothetical protein BOS5A_210921 [Bosea sp. EC-HK365B]|nr:hypothetical protein BOSE7B_120781 [Bosea sp. 7B]CAD5274137.1 hypothetical protein BOSE21B_30131 [Bosea sp. 21B]VVT60130.1 hypothetical protein BOS5A_210921 [Bosea sp. EC-HK365B]VXC18589.1 hypothetical protein BOSE127_170419 [Bosea sp. 127]
MLLGPQVPLNRKPRSAGAGKSC